jgi:hypothetical protein
LSEARDAGDLRRQFAKEAGDRSLHASGDVGIAGFRCVLESGLGIVDLADNLVIFGIETIIAAARWGIETSNYWFKATTQGVLRSFTDFVNAYAPISKQYHEYVGKSRKGASA